MYLGRPISKINDDIADRLRGLKSTLGHNVYITDGQIDRILGVITPKNVIFDRHEKTFEDTREEYEITLIGEMSYDEHLKKGNRLIIYGEWHDDGELVEFVIDDVDDKRRNGKEIKINAYASYLDLRKAKAIEPFSFTGTAREHLIHAFSNTEHEVGVVESSREITLSFENWTNPFEYARRVAREFDLELNFRVEHNGMMIMNRVVDALDRIGAWRGREITFTKDMLEINRLESGDIYTALIGLGPEREDGTRLQVLVDDREALEIWGRPIHDPKHLIGIYEPQSEREDMTLSELRQYTRTELSKRKNSAINWEVSFLDLEYILGQENKKIRFGDTIRIKDTMYTPHLYVEARIYGMERSAVMPSMKFYKLGDFIEYDAETIHSIYDILKRQLAKKAGIQQLLDYAEPKKVESNTPPTIKDGENPIWVDTSKTPKVAHVVIGGQWQKMTPTTPQEVDAYTKQQVDSKDQSIYQNSAAYTDQKSQAEAAQALADAKAFSRNARNITEGVIDVGAIPLRTSVTGARLEWDGVNGLVQYNALGEPVSWLDLDANAHFANAFLSGRVEANSGHFGKNKRVTIGDDGLTIQRPDGATWMQNGIVHQDYTVGGFDPLQVDGVTHKGFRYADAIQYYNKFYRSDWLSRIDGTETDYTDIRDESKGYTISFHTYEVIHSARYIVFGMRSANNSNQPSQFRVRAYDGSIMLGSIDLDRYSGYSPLIIDLGVPTYERVAINLRIGFLRQWKNTPQDEIAFRINRIYLTDVL